MSRPRYQLPPILVFSRDEAEAFVVPDASAFAISITDPGTAEANLRGYGMVLRLTFCDVHNGLDVPPGYDNMSREQAIAVMGFVERARVSASVLVIHCEAGASRSPSTAAAIDYVYGRRPHPYDLMNFAVFGRLLRAAWHLHIGVYGQPHRTRRGSRGRNLNVRVTSP